MWLWSNKSDCYTVPPLSIALCFVLYSSSLQLPLSPCSLRPFSHTPQPQIIITPMREYKWEYVNVNELVLVWLFVVFRRTALFFRGKSMVMDMIEKVNYQTSLMSHLWIFPSPRLLFRTLFSILAKGCWLRDVRSIFNSFDGRLAYISLSSGRRRG